MRSAITELHKANESQFVVKPLLYYEALQHGFTAASTFMSERRNLRMMKEDKRTLQTTSTIITQMILLQCSKLWPFPIILPLKLTYLSVQTNS